MDRYWRGRSSGVLWTFMLLGLAYSVLMYVYNPLTGEVRLDGAVAVVLGLYICSHPASNVLDLLFAEGGVSRHASAERHGAAWYVLNLLVLLAGWLVVFMGVTRFTSGA